MKSINMRPPKSKINGYSIPNVNESLFVKFGKNPKIEGATDKVERKIKSLSSIFKIASCHSKNIITVIEKVAINS